MNLKLLVILLALLGSMYPILLNIFKRKSSTNPIPENVKAPIKAGDKIGEATIMAGDQVIGTVFIRAAESINRLTFSEILKRLIGSFFYS